MKSKITEALFWMRALVVRKVKPSSAYPLFPISSNYGMDRGDPIDRHYIELFLEEHSELIKGHCLEVTSNKYTKRFGGSKVTKSDVIDINKGNKNANIHADLEDLKGKISNNTYDCIILTHTLGEIRDYEAVISEIARILKPSGTLIFTSAVMNIIHPKSNNYWRFTKSSTELIFSKYFRPDSLNVRTYGNIAAGQAFWVGLSKNDLNTKHLEHNDERYPIIVAATAKIG